MDIFGVLTLIGGLALFLYGMNVMGAGLEKMSGGKLEKILETLTSKPDQGSVAWCRCNRSDPVVIGDDGYGGWFCELRYYEAVTGSRHHYGCKYRNNGNVMAFELKWTAGG